MCVFWIGHMCAKRHLGAKRCALRMKGRSWRSARQESLEHKRIEGEGREPLLKQSLKSCPPLVHGENRASKNRFGQAAREDVMGEKQPGIQCGYGWGRNSQVIEKNGRSERIRTSDPLVPNEVRYQAALHSDIWRGVPTAGEGPYSDAGRGGQGPRALRGADFPLSCRLVFS